MARALGLTGIGLGLAEMAMPDRLSRRLGLRDARTVLRAMGAREILSGVGILAPRNPTVGLWSRVAGDAMDLGLLGVAAARSRNRKMVAGAIGMVAAISA
ncbi:MAG TPA: hypothetical protein VFR95_10305, partial [Gemmatimonadaceae bacterium]|nr:hypothetical protein [Gemmatimonadaceae bacterium]